MYIPWSPSVRLCDVVLPSTTDRRRRTPGLIDGLVTFKVLVVMSGVSVSPPDVVMLPTPAILELETHSTLSASCLLIITPLLAMGPDDIFLSAVKAYIPAPENESIAHCDRESET